VTSFGNHTVRWVVGDPPYTWRAGVVEACVVFDDVVVGFSFLLHRWGDVGDVVLARLEMR
jgi:hypothetical protein